MEHEGHNHQSDNERRVLLAMLLTGSFMLIEVAGGLISGSLALLADAGHMLTDFVSLALAYFGFRISHRKPDLKRSYGYHRFQILAAFVNGLTLFAIALWIVIEAIQRLKSPVEVLGTPMLWVATAGLFINLVVIRILHGGDSENLNIRGAMLHVLGDLLGSVAAIAASIIILWKGWMPIDPLLSMLVALLILRAAFSVVRDSGHILLQGTPQNVDPVDLREKITTLVPAVTDVHHVHIWSLTNERPVITLHAVIVDDANENDTLIAVQKTLKELFGIAHATVQLERGDCPDKVCAQDEKPFNNHDELARH